jgi:hypothetical protein
MTSVDNPAAFAGLVGIGTGGNIGMVVGDQWTDLGLLGGQPVVSLTMDTKGILYGVGIDGTYSSWDTDTKGWESQLNDGSAYRADVRAGDGDILTPGFDDRVRMEFADSQGYGWCVYWTGEVSGSNSDGENITRGLLGNWTLKSIAVDKWNVIWGVGTDGNIGQLLPNNTWDDYTSIFGGWTFNVYTFAPDGGTWCVGSEGNVGQWDGANERWIDHGLVGGWTMANLFWPPAGTPFPPPQ